MQTIYETPLLKLSRTSALNCFSRRFSSAVEVEHGDTTGLALHLMPILSIHLFSIHAYTREKSNLFGFLFVAKELVAFHAGKRSQNMQQKRGQ